jgi:glucose-6-phosphate-specific signal transduction histidine kinase
MTSFIEAVKSKVNILQKVKEHMDQFKKEGKVIQELAKDIWKAVLDLIKEKKYQYLGFLK